MNLRKGAGAVSIVIRSSVSFTSRNFSKISRQELAEGGAFLAYIGGRSPVPSVMGQGF